VWWVLLRDAYWAAAPAAWRKVCKACWALANALCIVQQQRLGSLMISAAAAAAGAVKQRCFAHAERAAKAVAHKGGSRVAARSPLA
jgi:hypothetical protein